MSVVSDTLHRCLHGLYACLESVMWIKLAIQKNLYLLARLYSRLNDTLPLKVEGIELQLQFKCWKKSETAKQL